MKKQFASIGMLVAIFISLFSNHSSEQLFAENSQIHVSSVDEETRNYLKIENIPGPVGRGLAQQIHGADTLLSGYEGFTSQMDVRVPSVVDGRKIYFFNYNKDRAVVTNPAYSYENRGTVVLNGDKLELYGWDSATQAYTVPLSWYDENHNSLSEIIMESGEWYHFEWNVDFVSPDELKNIQSGISPVGSGTTATKAQMIIKNSFNQIVAQTDIYDAKPYSISQYEVAIMEYFNPGDNLDYRVDLDNLSVVGNTRGDHTLVSEEDFETFSLDTNYAAIIASHGSIQIADADDIMNNSVVAMDQDYLKTGIRYSLEEGKIKIDFDSLVLKAELSKDSISLLANGTVIPSMYEIEYITDPQDASLVNGVILNYIGLDYNMEYTLKISDTIKDLNGVAISDNEQVYRFRTLSESRNKLQITTAILDDSSTVVDGSNLSLNSNIQGYTKITNPSGQPRVFTLVLAIYENGNFKNIETRQEKIEAYSTMEVASDFIHVDGSNYVGKVMIWNNEDQRIPLAGDWDSIEKYTVKNMRFDQINAEATIVLKGKPNTNALVEIVHSEELMKLKTAQQPFTQMVEIPASGEISLNYTSIRTGIYVVSAFGEIDEITYTTINNEIPEQQYEGFYAELWRWDNSNAYNTENMFVKVELTKQMLDNYGSETAAKMIYQELKNRPAGKRSLFIGADLSEHIVQGNGTTQKAYIWWDQGAEEVSQYMDSFFDAYYHLGGQVDVVYSDFEKVNTNWGLSHPDVFNGNLGEMDNFLKNVVETDSRYPALHAQLESRGFIFDTNGSHSELLGVVNWNTASFKYSYLIWNTVMETMRSGYLNQAIYNPAKKYYPNIKYSNYQDVALDPTIDFGAFDKPTFLGGEKINAGTHSSPEAYPRTIFNVMSGNRDHVESIGLDPTPYNSMLYHTNRIKSSMLATTDKKIMPWISTTSFNEIELLGDSSYYHEYFLHVGLSNPDPFLVFGPQYYIGDNQASVDSSALLINDLLAELNSLAGSSDRYTLVNDLASWEDGYTLSGIYANGKHIYRITPDIDKVSSIEAFLTNRERCEFIVDDKKIKFPGGTIVDNMVSEYGYWVVMDPTAEFIIEDYDGTIQMETEITWIDNNDSYHTRPQTIDVNLLQNGIVIDTVNVKEVDDWKRVFPSLTEFDNYNQAYEYTIQPSDVENYNYEVLDMNATYSLSGSVVITKPIVWIDEADENKLRPSSVIVDLYQNDIKIDSTTIGSNENWLVSFDKLKKYDDQGKLYVYRINPQQVLGYVTDLTSPIAIINHLDKDAVKIKVSGSIIWEDSQYESKRPEYVIVELYQNGEKIDEINVGLSLEWNYIFDSLSKYDSTGNKYEYTIKQVLLANYTTTYNGYEVINTYKIDNNDSNNNLESDSNTGDKNRSDNHSNNSKEKSSGTKAKKIVVTSDISFRREYQNLLLLVTFVIGFIVIKKDKV